MTDSPVDQAAIIASRRQSATGIYLEASRAITDNVRLVGLGYLFIYFYSMYEPALKAAVANHELPLLVIGISGILTILLDYGQQLCRYSAAFAAARSPDAEFDETRFSYRWAVRLFYAKQVAAALGGVLLIFIFVSRAV